MEKDIGTSALPGHVLSHTSILNGDTRNDMCPSPELMSSLSTLTLIRIRRRSIDPPPLEMLSEAFFNHLS